MSVDMQSTPEFFAAIKSDFVAAVAHTFIVHGATGDYVPGATQDMDARDYIAKRLKRTCIVCTYSVDEGPRFPNGGDDRTAFESAVGLGEGPADAMANLFESPAGGASSKPELPTSPAAALPMLLTFLREGIEGDERVPCVIIDRLDLIVPPGDVSTMQDSQKAILASLHRLGTDARIDTSGGMCIMLTEDLEAVHSDIRSASSGIRTVEIAPPTFEQRLAYIRRVVESKGVTLQVSEAEFASATAGLMLRNIEDIALRAAAADGVVTLALVMERGAELIRQEYAGVLKVRRPTHGFEKVGGQARIIDFVRRRVIRPFLDPELSEDVPLGLVFMGPSGTGKTWLAEAVGYEVQVNFCEFDPGACKDGRVGSTESNIRKAFRGIEALAPCVVFIDEIDQSTRRGQGGSDSGGGGQVENSVFASMLKFFGDPTHRGRILAIAATNRPDVVDAALFRPGRFDVKIPLLPPDESERADIVATLLRSRGYETTGEVLADVAARTEDYTHAELDSLVVEARALARLEGFAIDAALVEALATLKPATKDVPFHTALALEACNNVRLVPERFRSRVGKRDETIAREPSEPRERQARSGRNIDL